MKGKRADLLIIDDSVAPKPTLLTRSTVMRAAFEDAGYRPRTRAGVNREPAWNIHKQPRGKHERKAR